MSSNNMSSKGSFGGVLNESNDNSKTKLNSASDNESLKNYSDIDVDDDDIHNVETLGSIIKGYSKENSESKKRRLSNESNDTNKSKVMKDSTNSNQTTSGVHLANRNSKDAQGRVPPVIFFKVSEKPDKVVIEEYLIANAKDVDIKDFKITANNNVLIYTSSNEENEKLANNRSLFENKGRLNLNAIDRKPYLMIKNVSYDFIKNSEDALKGLGIIEIIAMRSKSNGRLLNFVKVLAENEDTKKKLLNERFIRIALSKLYLEDFTRPPTQCRKCKAFGHIEKNCKSNQKCGKCSRNHVEEECNVNKEEYKCANCECNHSAFYRGCNNFREAKNLLLLTSKKQTIVSTGNELKEAGCALDNSSKFITERRYSSVVSNESDILKKFNELLVSNNTTLNKQTEEIVKRESAESIKTIEKIMSINNQKLCYFVIDTIKLLVPSVKFSETKLKCIEKAFSSHQLGYVNGKNLIDNYCPQNKRNTSRQRNLDDDDDDSSDNCSGYIPSKIND